MPIPSPTMLALAERVSVATGLHVATVVSQWVSEQGWWEVQSNGINNPGNITAPGSGALRYGATSTARYPGNLRWFLVWPTMEAGAMGYAAYYNANKGPGGYYWNVAQAPDARHQLLAFGESAYGGASPETLVGIYDSLPGWVKEWTLDRTGNTQPQPQPVSTQPLRRYTTAAFVAGCLPIIFKGEMP